MLPPPRISVEEFHLLPRIDDQVHELHNGVLVQSKRANKRQDGRIFRARRVLQPFAAPIGILMPHFPFCPLAEFELRFADLAFISQERWDRIPEAGYLAGAPDLIVEMFAPNDTQEELKQKSNLCLANGCTEFWIVHTERQEIEITTAAGSRTYSRGSTLPLLSFSGQSLSAAALFPPQLQPGKQP